MPLPIVFLILPFIFVIGETAIYYIYRVPFLGMFASLMYPFLYYIYAASFRECKHSGQVLLLILSLLCAVFLSNIRYYPEYYLTRCIGTEVRCASPVDAFKVYVEHEYVGRFEDREKAMKTIREVVNQKNDGTSEGIINILMFIVPTVLMWLAAAILSTVPAIMAGVLIESLFVVVWGLIAEFIIETF